jgi:hypothetical protein
MRTGEADPGHAGHVFGSPISGSDPGSWIQPGSFRGIKGHNSDNRKNQKSGSILPADL